MNDAPTASFHSFWESLPEELKVKLRLGFTGRLHLLDIAGWCMRSGDPSLTPLAVDAMQVAFGENPLSGEMAAELTRHDGVRAVLPPETAQCLTLLAENWHKPESSGYYERLLTRRDFSKIRSFVEKSIAKEPNNLYWREQALTMGLIDGDPQWTAYMTAFPAIPGLEPIAANIESTISMMQGKTVTHEFLRSQVGETFGPGFVATRSGQDLFEAHTLTPWNINLALRAYDQKNGISTQHAPLPGRTAILLYSWNKGPELHTTLQSLSESKLDNADIFVLNNGSTDNTGDVLEFWAPRFEAKLGAGRFKTVTLPVNVGAPAARNWLMHMDDVQEHAFACYLDDDVVLPPDWLEKLGAAVDRYPNAGVWGCKVVDHANPALIQSADSHLLVDENESAQDLSRTDPNPFKLSDLHIQSLDCGQLDFMRPCTSVTGCCHLFRSTTLRECGDFAIHLSPSQYDDMEHDLRRALDGKFAVYQGHLTVRHKKRTGAASRVSPQEESNALGNKYKMQTMVERPALILAMNAEQQLLDTDLTTKIHTLGE